MSLIKFFLKRILYDRFKIKYGYLNEEENAREYYRCMRLMIQAHSHVFLNIFLIKHITKKRPCMKHKFLDRNNHEVSCNQHFCDS